MSKKIVSPKKAEIPKNHPRYLSLLARDLLEDGVNKNITTITGLIAHGRGEAFDYLLGERTHDFADKACQAAAASLLLANHPVLSINGNTAALVPQELISLAKSCKAELEVNLFHARPGRREAIKKHFKKFGVNHLLGLKPDANLTGLTSARGTVDSKGILIADVVVVSLEDGDRTEILCKHGKQVIAIDLNPFSRTPQKAQISIIDNVTRALPCIEKHIRKLKKNSPKSLEKILKEYNNKKILKASEKAIRKGC